MVPTSPHKRLEVEEEEEEEEDVYEDLTVFSATLREEVSAINYVVLNFSLSKTFLYFLKELLLLTYVHC